MAQPRNRHSPGRAQRHRGRVPSPGLFFFFPHCLKVQNTLEHGKKGICLGDSDMFQHFPTGSCSSQNNCNPGFCPLAYDYFGIMLQSSGHTHTGVAGMHSPGWGSVLCGWRKRECRPQQGEVLTHQNHPDHREGPRSALTFHRWGEKDPEREMIHSNLQFGEYKRKLLGELALVAHQIILIFFSCFKIQV